MFYPDDRLYGTSGWTTIRPKFTKKPTNARLNEVACDSLCTLGGELDLSSHRCETVRAAQSSCVYVGQCLLRDQINNGEGMIATTSIDGDGRCLSIT